LSLIAADVMTADCHTMKMKANLAENLLHDVRLINLHLCCSESAGRESDGDMRYSRRSLARRAFRRA
jgi:hypothetical protein